MKLNPKGILSKINKRKLFSWILLIVLLFVGYRYISQNISFVGGLPTFKKKAKFVKQDSKDIPMDIRKQLTLHFADHVSEYLELALEKKVDHEYM